jgi:hypothetical protein
MNKPYTFVTPALPGVDAWPNYGEECAKRERDRQQWENSPLCRQIEANNAAFRAAQETKAREAHARREREEREWRESAIRFEAAYVTLGCVFLAFVMWGGVIKPILRAVGVL